MNVREVYDTIRSNKPADQQQALFELLSLVETLSIAVLEVAGGLKQTTGGDPLMTKSRERLSEFIDVGGCHS